MTRNMLVARFFAHLSCSVHLIYSGVYSLILMYTVSKISEKRSLQQPVIDFKDFGLVYFTSWNMIIQISYFILATAHDVFLMTGWNVDWRRKLDDWKGYVFITFAFPCSLFVGSMFWTIYFYDRELVLPAVVDEFVPTWVNHAVHTDIMVLAAVEMLITYQMMPNLKKALFGLCALHISYDILYLTVYYITKRWIYALYYALDWPERAGMMVFNLILAIVIFFIGYSIEKYKHSLMEKRKCQQDINKKLVYDKETKEEETKSLTK